MNKKEQKKIYMISKHCTHCSRISNDKAKKFVGVLEVEFDVMARELFDNGTQHIQNKNARNRLGRRYSAECYIMRFRWIPIRLIY